MSELNPDVIATQKAFLRYLLNQMDLKDLTTAIALEEVASEIRIRVAAGAAAAG